MKWGYDMGNKKKYTGKMHGSADDLIARAKKVYAKGDKAVSEGKKLVAKSKKMRGEKVTTKKTNKNSWSK